MITDVNYIRQNFQVEEGCTDTFLFSRICDAEDVVAGKFANDYPDWDADITEVLYAEQRKLVKKTVSNMVLCVLLRSFGFVVTSFGNVQKRDEYSTPMTDTQRWEIATAYGDRASESFRKLCELQGEKYDYTKDMAGHLSTAEGL